MKVAAIVLTVFSICSGAISTIAAQQRGEVYAAPGMSVRVPGPVTSPVLRPARKVSPPTIKNREAATRLASPIESPVFPRFWHQAEPARSQAKNNYYQFQQQHIKYPVTSLRAGIGGSVSALLTVFPDGKVGTVRIIRRVLDEAATSIDTPSPAAEAALDAEVIRVVSQMRFEPSTILKDTVTVSQRFSFQ